ncbi:hypothetical protein IQ243_06065 [Nostocales cyanobacterium LEGE 11386]|nr:hypothetical protein [Nostocales cyanobacterium LEGE 11386]
MLYMKWNLNDQGCLSANWVQSDKLLEQHEDDTKLLKELQLICNLYAALDAVFLTSSHR